MTPTRFPLRDAFLPWKWADIHRGFPIRFLLAGMAFLSCQDAGHESTPEDEPAPEVQRPLFSLTVGEVGFSTPESVLHDPASDVYLVANIEGAVTEEDGNGFISRVSPTGEVLELKWIDGAVPGITLDAPKGMALVADTLFVADIRCVRRFHRTTGASLQDLCLEEATFLNDLTSSVGGDLYFSDTGNGSVPGAVYLLRNTADVPQKLTLADGTVLEGSWLGGPNGLFAHAGGLDVVTFDSGELFRITPDGERIDLLEPSEYGFDGVVSLAERGVLVSSWDWSAIFLVGVDGTFSTVVEDVEAPADIGYDATRNRLLIPLFRRDEIMIREVR